MELVETCSVDSRRLDFERRWPVREARRRIRVARQSARRRSAAWRTACSISNRELRCAGFELRDLLAIEGDAIFGAIEIESGLAEQVLRLAKFGIEIVGARAQALLLGFKLVHGAGIALFGGVHIAEKFFQARGFDIEMLRAAGEHDAQQAAHLFAQLGVAPRLGCLALQRSELLFDFDENVVDARKIDLRGFELGFRQALLGLVHGDAGGFFDDRAAVHGLGIQDLADAALLDDGVAIRAETDAHEDFLDVAQAGDAAIDQIFALSGTIQAATDDDFAESYGDRGLFGGALLPVLAASGGSSAGDFVRGRFRYDFGESDDRVAGVCRIGRVHQRAGSDAPSSTLATASESSGSTRVRVTSEMPIGGRLAVPLKMQSDMRSARSILWLCSPRTQEIASTTLDLPQPFGPTMQVIPLPLNVIGVFSQNDLKPRSSTLRSFSTRPLARFAPCASNAEGGSV